MQGELAEIYRVMSESGRFGAGVLDRLARILTGRGGGANRDTPLYELCHLIVALAAFGHGDQDSRLRFFLGETRVSAAGLRQMIAGAATSRDDRVSMTDKGLLVEYRDTEFELRFSRMPVLVALYEFLACMENWAFFDHLNRIFDQLSADKADLAAVRTATGRIAARFRKYRHQQLDWARHEEKFARLAPFLAARAENDHWRIDDAAILDFWRLHSKGREFRGYKTVMSAFVTLLRVFRAQQAADALAQARPLGADRAAGEVEPAFAAEPPPPEWQNPLPCFDDPALAGIRFFMQARERRPLQQFLDYGPDASRLPLAYLRLHAFHPVQSAITTDLQVKRDPARTRARLDCGAAKNYRLIADEFDALAAHVERLQLATLYAIAATPAGGEDTGCGKVSAIMERAERAFAGLNRRGFEADRLDPARRDAFRQASTALVTIGEQLAAYGQRLKRLDRGEADLDLRFDDDKAVFAGQFERIYGGGYGGGG